LAVSLRTQTMPVKVSIVVPNYNHARFLDERMTSLLNQTFTDIELIFVDDGSTDNSRAVIEKYLSDPRVKSLWFKPNCGTIFGRWNDGISIATGEYLMFANADDACDPTLLETLVRLLDAHPHVGVACTQSWEINAASERVKIKQSKPRWAEDFIVSGVEEAPYLLTEPTVQNTSAALVRRSLVEQCGGLDLSVGICADWMMFARLHSVSHLAYVAEPLNYYRKHDRTLRATKGAGNDIFEQYQVVDFILRAFALSEQARQDAWDRLANSLISKALMDGWTGDFTQQRRIYERAKSFDPNVRRRLLRLASRRALGRLRRRWLGN
jgi:glycosyltransferase involved in cell wall biosynthesis